MEGICIAFDEADVAVGQAMNWAGSYEPHVCNAFRHLISPGQTVLDVGANIGFLSMLASELVGETGRVVSFEPNSENCRLIALSCQMTGRQNVRLCPVALADRADAAFFTPAIGSNGTLLPNDPKTLMNPNCMVVPTFPLDEIYNGSVDFMKIDTEGAEYLVLKGARRVIAENNPIILCEFAAKMLELVSKVTIDEHLGLVQELGYSFYLIESSSIVEQDVTAIKQRHGDYVGQIDDLLLVPDSKRDIVRVLRQQVAALDD